MQPVVEGGVQRPRRQPPQGHGTGLHRGWDVRVLGGDGWQTLCPCDHGVL
jgi:hypothetical protein